MKLNFRTSDFRRQVADANSLILRNRYFEQNPFLTEEPTSLIARPGLRRLTYAGDGPIRGLASEAGSFNGDLFIASGAVMFRMDNTLTQTAIYSGLEEAMRGFVNMAITARIGETPEYLFFTDGRLLYVYIENGYALNYLTGTPADNDTVNLNGVYYKWTTGDVNAGTPDGTSGQPWLVNLGLTSTEAFGNLQGAINANGNDGVDYTSSITSNDYILAIGFEAAGVHVRARQVGAPGNGLTVAETGASLDWAQGGNLVGGGQPSVSQVYMPEDVGVIDVAVTQSYVIVIPAQTGGFQGRFYWIEPGETTVNPVNFATAERSPDGVYGVQVFGDNFWLPGESTTEVWYVTGDPAAPVRRTQGVVFDRGSWQNTALAVHETLVVVDADGGVFLIKGGSPQRVSTPDIEEQIRKAMARQNTYLL